MKLEVSSTHIKEATQECKSSPKRIQKWVGLAVLPPHHRSNFIEDLRTIWFGRHFKIHLIQAPCRDSFHENFPCSIWQEDFL